jgi:hypothetical protein
MITSDLYGLGQDRREYRPHEQLTQGGQLQRILCINFKKMCGAKELGHNFGGGINPLDTSLRVNKSAMPA